MAIKQIKVTLQSTIKQHQQTDTIQKDYVGEYNIINGIHYMRLHDDNGKLTLKLDHRTKQLTCLFDNHAVKRVVFDTKSHTKMDYQIPQGIMFLTVKTTQLLYELNGEYLTKIQLHYHLWHDNTLFGQYKQEYSVHDLN